jgi:nucleoside-diphosphate-sugar epimerase
MIIGSGMIAQAFFPLAAKDPGLCVYAYGVSNSRCADPAAFLRELRALAQALEQQRDATFVYFGTCSVDDPEMQQSPYVLHKLRMEAMVGAHDKGIVVRLPQVAGATHNPATLLSFLAHHLVNGAPFDLWLNARRNIIDVADVVLIVQRMLTQGGFHNRVVNVANTRSYAMLDIVTTMEEVLGRKAVYRTRPRGSAYLIDITATRACMDAAGVRFDQDYLANVIHRYYANLRVHVATSR